MAVSINTKKAYQSYLSGQRKRHGGKLAKSTLTFAQWKKKQGKGQKSTRTSAVERRLKGSGLSYSEIQKLRNK
jgi:hypothetical protein